MFNSNNHSIFEIRLSAPKSYCSRSTSAVQALVRYLRLRVSLRVYWHSFSVHQDLFASRDPLLSQVLSTPLGTLKIKREFYKLPCYFKSNTSKHASAFLTFFSLNIANGYAKLISACNESLRKFQCRSSLWFQLQVVVQNTFLGFVIKLLQLQLMLIFVSIFFMSRNIFFCLFNEYWLQNLYYFHK